LGIGLDLARAFALPDSEFIWIRILTNPPTPPRIYFAELFLHHGEDYGKERIMKRLLLLLAIVVAFTFTAIAQDASQTGGTSSQTTTTTKTKKSKKAAASEQSGAAASDQGGKKAKKESTLTGCLSAQPNADGMYTLSNGRYKKGVEVGPADQVKDHAGHQVALKGQWATAAATGETKAAGKEKAERHFDVASVKHLSDTCSAAPGGGTTGATKSGEKKMKKGKSETGTTNPPPSM
jgi:hypothetical protein